MRNGRRLARWTVALLVTGATTVAWPPVSAPADEEGGLRVVGQMTRPADFFKRPMAVDEARNLGFVTTSGGDPYLYLMDLERLVPLASVSEKRDPNNAKVEGYSPESGLALDIERGRLYPTMPSYPGISGTTCRDRNGQPVFAYGRGPEGRWALTEHWMGPMPCWGQEQFFALTASYDPGSERLYMGGVPSTSEGWRGPPSGVFPLPEVLGGPMAEDRGQALLVRQLRIGEGPLLPFDFLIGADGTRNSLGRGAAQFGLEWGLDLRLAGCGRREPRSLEVFEGFVARVGEEVLAYCWDARPYRGLQAGQQGYLVRIPLEERGGAMKPRTRGAEQLDPVTGDILNYVYRRVPTLPGQVTPVFDPVSGRIMLVTTDRTNGNAVWVFDPRNERFVGVITGGYADEKRGNIAVGFDSHRGRVYLLTKRGVLIAPIRLDPLPAGLLYPVLVNTEDREDFVSSNRISVAPKLGRLFVAQAGTYQVLEDRVPDPPTPAPPDPDALTTALPEAEGRTAAASGGQALASGLHLVNTGGLPRAVGQNDPTCFVAPPNVQAPSPGSYQGPIPPWELAPAVVGSCLPDLAVAAGHREAAAAAADLEAGTGSGASARGAAFGFGSTDTGTDGDVRRATDCGADSPDQVDRWGRRWPFPDNASISGAFPDGDGIFGNDPAKQERARQYNEGRNAFWNPVFGSDQFREGQQDYRGGCNDVQQGVADEGGPDLRAGTKGAHGQGFPIPAATCGDFGGRPSADAWPEPAAGQPQAAYPSSSATCDASGPTAQGVASVGALALPSAADPQLSVTRAWSKVSSARTPQGQVTVALAVAEGVTAGPLSIAQVRSLALTAAHGHRGTASAVLVRQWCGIRVADQSEEGCVDAGSAQVKDLLDEVNAAALQKIQLSVPEGSTAATPKGYQAVVTKSPGQRGGDQTVNDDDSHTVAALQAVVYNDGPRGRSRLVVQVAGVHAESRYGIIELPDFGAGSFGEPEPEAAPIETETEPAPAEPVAEAPPAPAPPPDPFTPESFLEEEFGPAEQERFSPAPPRTVPGRGTGGSPLRRVVRVPVQVLSDAINLLVQNPREAALLFVTWALLAAPLYLGLRRRSFARALVA